MPVVLRLVAFVVLRLVALGVLVRGSAALLAVGLERVLESVAVQALVVEGQVQELALGRWFERERELDSVRQ